MNRCRFSVAAASNDNALRARMSQEWMKGARIDELPVRRGSLRHAYRSLRGGAWHDAIAALHEREPLAVALSDYQPIVSAGRLNAIHFPQDDHVSSTIDDRVLYMDSARA